MVSQAGFVACEFTLLPSLAKGQYVDGDAGAVAKGYGYGTRGATIESVKATVPALVCLAGMLVCSWKLYRFRPGATPHYKIEITVHGPDGKTIPVVSHR